MADNAPMKSPGPRGRGRPPVARQSVEARLRHMIVSGRFGVGERIPSVVDLAARFAVSQATIQQVLAILTADGFVLARGKRGTFVTDHPPHRANYAVTFTHGGIYPSPRSLQVAAMERAAQEIERDDPHRHMQFFYGVDWGYEHSVDYHRLLAEAQADRLAGVIFVGPPMGMVDSPLSRISDLPRVVLYDYLRPRTGEVAVRRSLESWTTMALERVASQGHRRVAMLTQPGSGVTADMLALHVQKMGLETRPHWTQHIGPYEALDARRAVELLFHREQTVRPDALLLRDDHHAIGAAEGLRAAGVRVPQDVTVVCNFNYPALVHIDQPFIWLGYDCRRLMRLSVEVIDAIRAGQLAPAAVVEPVFLDAIVASK